MAETQIRLDGWIEALASLPQASLEEAFVRADRAALIASISRGITHTLANALQVLWSPGIAQPLGDLGLNPARRVMLGLAHPADTAGPLILSEVLAEVDEWQRCQIGLPPVPVRITMEPGLPVAHSCATRLRHALLDLVTNAKEASAERLEAEVRIAASSGEDGLVVAVEDQGPGIPAGDLERVFAPFHTTKDHAGHLGIGLTVARLLLEKDQASLRAEGRGDGPGARLVVRLPRWQG